MLTETEKYKLSVYNIKEQLHSSNNCDIYLTQSSFDNKLYIKRIYKNSKMLELFNSIKNKKVRNTPEIFEVFYDGKDTIVIEEYILGHRADSITLTKQSLYKIINQILLSVEDLHSINIIHRDIKPSNIIVTKEYKAYLIDFGIARFYSDTLDTDTTQSGTKGFASPEQYGFQQTDFRSDIYSIGKTIDAFVKSNNINCKLKKVISKSISFDPNDRYSSVSALKKAININRFSIEICVLSVVVLILLLICFCIQINKKIINNEKKLSLAETTVNAINSEAESETTTDNKIIVGTTKITTAVGSTEITTTVEATKVTNTVKSPIPTAKQPTTAQSHTQPDVNNESSSEETKAPEIKNTAYDYCFYAGLYLPVDADFMEILGNESSKTGTIFINNTYVTVECVKNGSELTVNLSDDAGHRGTLSMNFTEEELEHSWYDSHSFNVYVFFIDYNNDGNTDILVNYTDAAQRFTNSGKLVFADESIGKPSLLWNRSKLRLAEHNAENGFYIYAETMVTEGIFQLLAGGTIYCDTTMSYYTTHDGIITEEVVQEMVQP